MEYNPSSSKIFRCQVPSRVRAWFRVILYKYILNAWEGNMEHVTQRKPPRSTLVFSGWQFPMLPSRAVNIYKMFVTRFRLPAARVLYGNMSSEATKGGGPSDETVWSEVPCHVRYGTIKIPPGPRIISTEQRPNRRQRWHHNMREKCLTNNK